jgi:glutamate dehydrogenase/leucine dehydrogenase
MPSRLPVRVIREPEFEGRSITVFRTEHANGVVAETAVHGDGLPHSVGGVRMVVAGDRQELRHLAAGMTDKNMAADLPCNGQKSLVVCPGGLPPTQRERAEILADHIRAVRVERPGVIFGPDMNTSEDVLDLIATDPELRNHLAGCTELWGGLSIDKEGYTGAGLFAAIDVARRERPDLRLQTASIQGFGAVGAHAGRLLERAGIAVVGLSTAQGAAIARKAGEALPVAELFQAWKRGGDAEVRAFCAAHEARIRWEADPDVLFELPADVFVPAARTTVLATAAELSAARAENPHVRDVAAFARATGVRLVAEGANHPLTYAAERVLEERGALVLPDVICNPGGVVGCMFEWALRARILSSPRERARVTQAARGYGEEVIRRNTAAVIRAGAGARTGARAIIDEATQRWMALPDPLATWRKEIDRWLSAGAAQDAAPPPAL